jgi:hypothetical protein
VKNTGWEWLTQDEMGGSSGSTVTKTGKNNILSPTEQLAREVIQNSWDAAQILRKEPGHTFLTRFRFVSFDAPSSAKIRESFCVDDLKSQFTKKLNIKETKAPLVIGNGSVRALIVEDFGAHGLYGAPKLQKRSIMYRALYTVGATGKDSADELSGGSFGLGKGAFINASSSHTVVAYSCFRQFEGDPVTRRLVGWTWHDDFEDGAEYFDGRAIFGEHFQQDSGVKVKPRPYEDSKADQLAGLLNISPRNASIPGDLGTSLVLFDPIIDPDDLCVAIEDNWWPAILEPSIRLTIEIVKEDGSVIYPKPSSRKDLQPLIRAYEIATQVSDAPLGKNEKKVSVPNYEKFSNIGNFGLVAEYSDEDRVTKTPPKTILTRGPRMVIGELDRKFNGKSVAIHAVFATSISNGDVDKALRQTEPAAHDRWSTNTGDEDSRASALLAAHIQAKFTQEINSFAKAMINEAPISPRKLLGFSRIFGKFFGDSKGNTPEPIVTLPISINFLSKNLVTNKKGEISLSQVVEIARRAGSDDDKDDMGDVFKVIPELAVLLEESARGDSIPLSVSCEEPGVSRDSKNNLIAKLERGQRIKVSILSDPYDHRWSTDLQFRVEAVAVK